MTKDYGSTERIVTEEEAKGQPADDERSSSSGSQEELRESERMLYFTDAVAAIAATLLVLPLMEAAADLASGETEEETGGDEAEEEVSAVVEEFYQRHWADVIYFIVSFWAVFVLWTRHIFVFAYVDKIVSKLLVVANGLWIFSIILMPLATKFAYQASEGGWLFYFAVVEANLIITAAMIFIIRMNPETRMVQEHGPTNHCLVTQVLLVGWCAISMVVAALVPPEQGAYGFIPFVFGPKLNEIILERCFKIKMERSPVDEVHRFYTKANFVTVTIGLFCKKLGLNLHKFEFDDEVRRAIFSRISERLIIFTDATVAISMTLLIIPLSDRTGEHKDSVAEFLSDQVWLLYAFLYSFGIVYNYWKIHDNMYAYEDGNVNPKFFLFSLPWLITIAFVPVASALADAKNVNESTSWREAQFLLTLTLNRIVAAALAFIVFHDGVDLPPEYLVPHVMAILLGSLGLGLSFVIPSPWAAFLFFLLFFNYPLATLLLKLWPGLPSLLTKQKRGKNKENVISC